MTPAETALLNGKQMWERARIIVVPDPNMMQELSAKDIALIGPEWWPEGPKGESPYSVTVWNGRARIDFDDDDDDQPKGFTESRCLQVSKSGEHWPLISLDDDVALHLAGSLIAAVEHARRTREET